MAGVIDLQRWRREHGVHEDDDCALDDAVSRLDGALSERAWERPPPWVVTELLSIQGCLSLGMTEEAVWRVERLTQRTERLRARAAAR